MSNYCDPMDCSLPGSSVHGIFEVRILEWIAISFSRGSSGPRNWTWVSCIAGGLLLCRLILYQLSQMGSPQNVFAMILTQWLCLIHFMSLNTKYHSVSERYLIVLERGEMITLTIYNSLKILPFVSGYLFFL